jgi:hypothetical protein
LIGHSAATRECISPTFSAGAAEKALSVRELVSTVGKFEATPRRGKKARSAKVAFILTELMILGRLGWLREVETEVLEKKMMYSI